MLTSAKENARVFLHAEPSNAYDKHAYKVLFWDCGKLNHVGYVQRHFAAKISAVMQGPSGYDNKKTYLVARLKNESKQSDMFEAEIIGSITDVQSLIKRDEALKTNGGIFDTPKKFASREQCEKDLWNKWNRSSIDQDDDTDMHDGVEECDLY